MADPGRLREETASDLRQIRTTCPELAATGHVRGFAAIMRERRGDRLPEWISSAAAGPLPHIRQFAEGLNSDFDAITAGLSSTWSSGQCEGQINRAKLLKRQGYGRSGLPLLRQRILLAPSR
ncbi:transposase [Streptomyces rimosus]|uniref:transposase n=1 Tax=Streptomyces rimosus TaxID=1927 RepID=UPI00067C4F46|nr:transposase [Streptomyces rimosus]